MAHLRKLPTYFVKGDERRAAYYTIDARELRAAGFVEEGAAPNKPIEAYKPAERQPEIVVEAGAEAYDSTDSLTESMAEEEALEDMTKAELLDWAMEKGYDLKNALPKAEIFKICKEIDTNPRLRAY